MKVHQAAIRLYLKTSKVLSDGSSPIMLRVSFNGFKEVSTHYSCDLRFWDKKREEVKKGYPNFLMINVSINKLKQLAIASRNRFIASEVDYTPQMILSSLYEEKSDCRALKDVIHKYIDEHSLKKNTEYNWNYLYHLMSEYRYDGILASELDEKCIKGFIQWCSSKGLSDGVIRMLCSNIGAICKYAIGLGIMSEDRYPFRTFRYGQHLKKSNNVLYIHRNTIGFIKEWFLDKVIVRNEGLWSYRDEMIEEVVNVNGSLYPLYMYLMMYLFQGLAPIDISLIRRDMIDVRRIKGNDYYCIDIKRQKTSKSVPIRIKRHVLFNEVMMGFMLLFGDGEYLLPILKGYSSKGEETRKHRVKWVFKCCMKRLSLLWGAINDDIIKHNVENAVEIPLIDDGCTYYSARHSYAQNYMEEGGNALSLATLLGRNVESIGTYVKSLSRDEDLVDVLI